MCVYLFLIFLLPYHAFQFGTFDTNTLEHFASAPKLESKEGSGEERERERVRVIFQLWMPAFWVSLWLIISYQSFNLGARSGRFKPWKQLALCSPTVRVSFAVDDGNIKAVSREWTSQSESLQLSLSTAILPLIIHATYTHIRNTLKRSYTILSFSQLYTGNIKLSNPVKLEMKWVLVISQTRLSLWYSIVQWASIQ